jgi:hypothetical protein
MNEKCEGAFEALIWVEDLIEKNRASPRGLEAVLTQVREMIKAVKSGVAGDFPFRLHSFV